MGTLVLSGYLENQKTDPAQEFDLNLGKLAATLDFFPPNGFHRASFSLKNSSWNPVFQSGFFGKP